MTKRSKQRWTTEEEDCICKRGPPADINLCPMCMEEFRELYFSAVGLLEALGRSAAPGNFGQFRVALQEAIYRVEPTIDKHFITSDHDRS